MKNPTDHEEACARVTARFPARFLRGYVSRKIRTDPVYPAVFEIVRQSDGPLLDVGCGVGLLAFYLRERGLTNRIIGLERDPRKVREAQRIAGAHYEDLEFRECDVQQSLPDFQGNVALLDVLHYLTPAHQQDLLAQLAARVCDGATLVLRDAPRAKNARFCLTYLGEKFAQAISWNMRTPLHFPSHDSICEEFPIEEFSRQATPLWGHTPFNNHLFTFRRHPFAVAPVAG